MSTSGNIKSPSVGITLMRKLLVVLLADVAVGLGLAILFVHYQPPLLLMCSLSAVGLGLVTGLVVRFVLSSRTSLLRGISAITALITGLFVLGAFTNWEAGIGPLNFHNTTTNWIGLAQVVSGTLTSLLAMHAWRRKLPRITSQPTLPVRRTSRHTSRSKQPRSGRASNPASNRAITTKIQSASPKIKRSRKSKPKTRSAFRPAPQMQLSTNVEHRCPYCLELIKTKDPRGVVECKVCHTRHHADCWSITGSCQVPHYNS